MDSENFTLIILGSEVNQPQEIGTRRFKRGDPWPKLPGPGEDFFYRRDSEIAIHVGNKV